METGSRYARASDLVLAEFAIWNHSESTSSVLGLKMHMVLVTHHHMLLRIGTFLLFYHILAQYKYFKYYNADFVNNIPD